MRGVRLSGRDLLAIAVGGALGGAARVGAGLLGDVGPGDGVPGWVVLVGVNLLGAFLIGLASAKGGRWGDPAVTTGLLGGFTSFSGWLLDVLQLASTVPLLALALLVSVPVATVAACLVGLFSGGVRS